MLPRLKHIVNEKEITKDILEEIIQELEHSISNKKISKIWIENNNEDKCIELNNYGGIKINIGNIYGLVIITRIIGMCTRILFILESDRILIRQLVYKFLKKRNNDIDENGFKYLMRHFVIITEGNYKHLTQNKYNLFE